MRLWVFHPLIFYPVTVILAALVVAASVRPQSWPRPAAPITAEAQGGALVIQGDAFDTPSPAPGQNLMVTRDFWGRAQTLKLAQAAGAAGSEGPGIGILIAAQQAARLSGQPLTVEIDYRPVPINAADGLAIRLMGDDASPWVEQPAPPPAGSLRFNLPAQTDVRGIALRAVSDSADQAYGIEITRIRVTPAA